ncbi:hypothetical protein Acy02nite_23780 [Actinoplanes cyaneus]|uniref:DUF416 family protein n=1 Tax=Actinoplanes cyaneus TaxID=52696 RepID=A0A919IFL3_9ACTN|nr:DUF416 family protein [Actinoplanes cyaneus]MCW2136357.1 Uncharacterized protein YjaG, DUF416 family [Actinoplanes cyaneus]GID64497.1 hypothetical protein Acy02nite_23780 [Actinoplanes cyaneus]
MVVPVRFDSEQLREDLAGLAQWQRVAFAAGCVEVLVPAYSKFSELEEIGDPALVRSCVDVIWSGLEGLDLSGTAAGLPSPESIKEMLPGEEDWNEWAPQAEDAIAALVYLLEILRDDNVDLAVYVAERAYAAADDYEAREQGLEVLGSEESEALLRASSIQTELLRQADALNALRDPAADFSVIASLRVAAMQAPVGGLAGSAG